MNKKLKSQIVAAHKKAGTAFHQFYNAIKTLDAFVRKIDAKDAAKLTGQTLKNFSVPLKKWTSIHTSASPTKLNKAVKAFTNADAAAEFDFYQFNYLVMSPLHTLGWKPIDKLAKIIESGYSKPIVEFILAVEGALKAEQNEADEKAAKAEAKKAAKAKKATKPSNENAEPSNSEMPPPQLADEDTSTSSAFE